MSQYSKENKIQKIDKNSIFVCATDTLYGICTSAFNKENVERIYEMKGRDENKPFIILISDIAELNQFGVTITKNQQAFLEKIWPGKVSVVLPCSLKKFEYLHRGTESLAFRMPKKNSIRDILENTGPLVAPSANKQGAKPAETITEAREIFGEEVDTYISDGKLKGDPSTIITFQGDTLVCTRVGAVPFDNLKEMY
jgi:L-threonylcarbamoyladenylate synthase